MPKEITSAPAENIDVRNTPSVISVHSNHKASVIEENKVTIMSGEESFTDARDLCNSTSDYPEMDDD